MISKIIFYSCMINLSKSFLLSSNHHLSHKININNIYLLEKEISNNQLKYYLI